jgi:hypothetical protein
MAGTVVADQLEAASTSTLVLKNGVANTPPTIQDSAGTEIGTFCRAWVNFNGTGTVAIRASFNISSVLDNGTGNYTISFTNAMSDANYSAVFGAAGVSGTEYRSNVGIVSATTTSLQIRTGIENTSGANAASDFSIINFAIFR